MSPVRPPHSQPVASTELPAVREAHLEDWEFLDYGQQLLPPEDTDAVQRHLDVCASCRDRLEDLHLDDDGTGATKMKDPLLGRTLGEYRVEEALARGGMGIVYRGVHPVIGKKVAIKVLLPREGGTDAIDRLLEEARAVNAIRHPNIIDIFSFGDLPDGKHYFVMELLDGLSLDEFLQQHGVFSSAEVTTVLQQAMSALGAAHAAGVIHRDLKPANLFVSTLPDGSWHVTVLDFGLAKRLGSASHTSTNMVMGTPGYMAPEQIRGKGAVPQTDLYAMGVVAWVLLTGREPFEAPGVLDLMRAHLDGPLPQLAALAPGASPGLRALVEKMLAKDPADRPASAMTVHAELRRLEQSGEARSPIIPADQLRKPNALVAAGKPSAEEGPLDPTVARARPRRDGETVARAPIRSATATATAMAAAAAAAGKTRIIRAHAPPAKRSSAPTVMVGSAVVIALAVAGWWLTREVEVTQPPRPEAPPAGRKTPDAPLPEQPAPPELAEAPDSGNEPAPPVAKTSDPVTEPAPPVAKIEPPRGVPEGKDKPSKAPRGRRAVELKLGRARAMAERFEPGLKRALNRRLDDLEDRLESGKDPAGLSDELDELMKDYADP